MKRLILTAALLLALAGSALAESYRVTYTTPRGQIHRVTVQAESSAGARRTVMALIPGAVVTGAHRITVYDRGNTVHTGEPTPTVASPAERSQSRIAP